MALPTIHDQCRRRAQDDLAIFHGGTIGTRWEMDAVRGATVGTANHMSHGGHNIETSRPLSVGWLTNSLPNDLDIEIRALADGGVRVPH